MYKDHAVANVKPAFFNLGFFIENTGASLNLSVSDDPSDQPWEIISLEIKD